MGGSAGPAVRGTPANPDKLAAACARQQRSKTHLGDTALGLLHSVYRASPASPHATGPGAGCGGRNG